MEFEFEGKKLSCAIANEFRFEGALYRVVKTGDSHHIERKDGQNWNRTGSLRIFLKAKELGLIND
jgi:hypothetical protein